MIVVFISISLGISTMARKEYCLYGIGLYLEIGLKEYKHLSDPDDDLHGCLVQSYNVCNHILERMTCTESKCYNYLYIWWYSKNSLFGQICGSNFLHQSYIHAWDVSISLSHQIFITM